MGLDCGGMFLGKHVLSFTKPKLLLGGGGKSPRQPTTESIVTHREFNPECGLLNVLKPCGMAPDELPETEPTCSKSSDRERPA